LMTYEFFSFLLILLHNLGKEKKKQILREA